MSDRYAPRWDERQQAWQVYNPATQGWYYTNSPPAGIEPSIDWEKNTAQQAYVPSVSKSLENNTPPPVNLPPIPKKETPKPKPKLESSTPPSVSSKPIPTRKATTLRPELEPKDVNSPDYYVSPQTMKDIMSSKYPNLKDIPVQLYNSQTKQPGTLYKLGDLPQYYIDHFIEKMSKHGFEQITNADGTISWRKRKK